MRIERCNPTEGTVLAKVITERNFGDIKRSEIFKSIEMPNCNAWKFWTYGESDLKRLV
jgi:hypothetical protein